jgi:hypothetical protein
MGHMGLIGTAHQSHRSHSYHRPRCNSFEDSLPDVASRSFKRWGEVGRTTVGSVNQGGIAGLSNCCHPGCNEDGSTG